MGKVGNRVVRRVVKSHRDPVRGGSSRLSIRLSTCPAGAAKRVIHCSAQPMSMPERSEPPFNTGARSAHNVQAVGAQ